MTADDANGWMCVCGHMLAKHGAETGPGCRWCDCASFAVAGVGAVPADEPTPEPKPICMMGVGGCKAGLELRDALAATEAERAKWADRATTAQFKVATGGDEIRSLRATLAAAEESRGWWIHQAEHLESCYEALEGRLAAVTELADKHKFDGVEGAFNQAQCSYCGGDWGYKVPDHHPDACCQARYDLLSVLGVPGEH